MRSWTANTDFITFPVSLIVSSNIWQSTEYTFCMSDISCQLNKH